MRHLAGALALVAVALPAGACSSDEEVAAPPVRSVVVADGELAAFRVEVGNPPRYEVVLVPPDGDGIETLVGEGEHGQPALFGRPAWSPDGSRLLVTVDRDRSHGRVGARLDLHVLEPGGELRRLTDLGDASAPLWSPEGRTIVFSRTDRSGVSAALHAMDADGGEPRPLLPGAEGTIDRAGSFSPDGALLAFTRTTIDPATGESRSAVWVVASDGTEPRRLAEPGADPAWSPDGSRIAFASDRDGNGTLTYGDRSVAAGELYVMDVDGGSLRRLTEARYVNERMPAWSPDGRRLAYQRGVTHENAKAASLYLLAPDADEEPRPLATDPSHSVWWAAPSWRPRSTDG